jgi:hypothetical protein
MSSLGVAWQRLLSFRVQRLPPSLAGVYLTTHYHTQTSVLSNVLPTADVPLLPGSRPSRLATISRQPLALTHCRL